MRNVKPLAAIAVAAIALALPSSSLAGVPIDPNLNDTVLGTVGGLRYATEATPFNPGNSNYADATAGCGTSAWHLVGGGGTAGGSPAHAWQAFDRGDDYTDPDFDLDDGFLVAGFGPSGSSIRTYSICSKSIQLLYRATSVGNQPNSHRSGNAACASPGYHVTSGSAAIATTGSWINSSFPIDDVDAGAVRDDGWRGTAYDTVNGMGGFLVTAICAHGVTLHYLHSGPVTVTAGLATSNRATCAATEHVVGGGAMVNQSPSAARLVVSAPYDAAADADTIPDDGWKTTVYNISGMDKTVTTFAICLAS